MTNARSTRLADGKYSLRHGYAVITSAGLLGALVETREEAEEIAARYPASVAVRIVYVSACVELRELHEHDEADAGRLRGRPAYADESSDERICRRGSAVDASPEERAALLRLK